MLSDRLRGDGSELADSGVEEELHIMASGSGGGGVGNCWHWSGAGWVGAVAALQLELCIQRGSPPINL